MKTPLDNKKMSHSSGETPINSEALWGGFLFALKALIYLAIFAELALVAFVLKALT